MSAVISTHNKIALLDLRMGFMIRTIESTEELLEFVIHAYIAETGIDAAKEKINDILLEIIDEEREDKYQEETGRCYRCGRYLEECVCE